MKKIYLFLILSLFCGCASVDYIDPNDQNIISTDFSATDLQQISESMVESLLNSPQVVNITAKRRPVIVVDIIRNKTRQHIDTEAITDSIRTCLIKSGKFEFIDRGSDKSGIAEVRYQQESGLVDPRSAVRFGKQVGAEYMLVGNISEIYTASTRERDVMYQMTLSLKNLQRGTLDWSDDKRIRKLSKRAIFGW